MDQEERRNLVAHYTSEENIMMVLEPLFLKGHIYNKIKDFRFSKKSLFLKVKLLLE